MIDRMWIYLILPLAALAGAIISGMLGMAGGILLLAIMFCFLPHAETIPAHAAVQLVSNSTRLIAFIKNIDWHTVGKFVIGVIPGAILGGLIYLKLGTPAASEPYLKMLVGIYILAVTFTPQPDKQDDGSDAKGFPLIGLIAGTAALTVGAVGPLIAPIFARAGFVKERLVATKAVCQTILHLIKLPFFIIAGSMRKFASFDIHRIGLLVLIMCLMVIPGTLIGKKMLKSVSPTQFQHLYRAALVLAGAKVLLYDGLYKILSQ